MAVPSPAVPAWGGTQSKIRYSFEGYYLIPAAQSYRSAAHQSLSLPRENGHASKVRYSQKPTFAAEVGNERPSREAGSSKSQILPFVPLHSSHTVDVDRRALMAPPATLAPPKRNTTTFEASVMASAARDDAWVNRITERDSGLLRARYSASNPPPPHACPGYGARSTAYLAGTVTYGETPR